MKNPEIESCTFEELAKEIKVETRTLYNWLRPIRQELLDMYPYPRRRLRMLMPKQIIKIKTFLVE